MNRASEVGFEIVHLDSCCIYLRGSLRRLLRKHRITSSVAFLFSGAQNDEECTNVYTCKSIEGVDRRIHARRLTCYVGAVYQSQIGSWVGTDIGFTNSLDLRWQQAHMPLAIVLFEV